MATREETVAQLTQIRDTLGTVASETAGLKDKIAELEERLASEDLPDDISALVADISSRVTALDDMVPNPDTVPTEPTPGEPGTPGEPTTPPVV